MTAGYLANVSAHPVARPIRLHSALLEHLPEPEVDPPVATTDGEVEADVQVRLGVGGKAEASANARQQLAAVFFVDGFEDCAHARKADGSQPWTEEAFPVDAFVQVTGVVDADGDGKDDLISQHPDSGRLWLWWMDGTRSSGVAAVR